jgi:hypothetical protein
MATTESTIIGKLHTPVDESSGERKIILLRTTSDLVSDPVTGESVKATLKNLQNSVKDATETSSGQMTPEMVTNLNNLMGDQVIISPAQPSVCECLWYQVEAEERS